MSASLNTIAHRIRTDDVLRSLDEAVRRLTGTKLLVLLSDRTDPLPVQVIGERDGMPEFCTLVQESEEGQRRCMACRCLLLLNAVSRGVADHSCHGLVSVCASPAGNPDREDGIFAVITTCAFRASEEDPWPVVRAQMKGLPVSMRELRRAYERLAVIPAHRRESLHALIEVAATCVGAMLANVSDTHSVATPTRSADGHSEVDVHGHLGHAALAAREAQRTHRAATLVRAVKAVVARNPGAPLSVKSISRAVGLTPNHFSSIFRCKAGERFVDFLNRRRIEEAKRLLMQPDLKVADAGRRAGFEHPAYFSRRFKQATGMTPDRWRARHAKQSGGVNGGDGKGSSECRVQGSKPCTVGWRPQSRSGHTTPRPCGTLDSTVSSRIRLPARGGCGVCRR